MSAADAPGIPSLVPRPGSPNVESSSGSQSPGHTEDAVSARSNAVAVEISTDNGRVSVSLTPVSQSHAQAPSPVSLRGQVLGATRSDAEPPAAADAAQTLPAVTETEANGRFSQGPPLLDTQVRS